MSRGMHPNNGRKSGHNQSTIYLTHRRTLQVKSMQEAEMGRHPAQGRGCQRNDRNIARIAINTAIAVKKTLISVVSRVAIT